MPFIPFRSLCFLLRGIISMAIAEARGMSELPEGEGKEGKKVGKSRIHVVSGRTVGGKKRDH